MKKSEAIVLANKYITEALEVYNCFQGEQFLEVAKKLGMQPPTITILKDSYNRTDGCMGFEVNEWEQE